MWVACHSQQDIPDAIGFSQFAVSEFVKDLQVIGNGTDAEDYNSSENPALTKEEYDIDREFEDEEETDKTMRKIEQITIFVL